MCKIHKTHFLALMKQVIRTDVSPIFTQTTKYVITLNNITTGQMVLSSVQNIVNSSYDETVTVVHFHNNMWNHPQFYIISDVRE